jgi:hypothetical protein
MTLTATLLLMVTGLAVGSGWPSAMLTVVLFLESHIQPVLISDEIRTVFLGAILAVCGYIAKTAGNVRDDVHNIKRDVPKIQQLLADHEREIRWLTAKRIAQEAIEEAERQSFQGPDRRHHLRRDRDVVNEALAKEFPYNTEDK